MNQTQTQWYLQLKPGDKVGVVNPDRTRVSIFQVQRITPSGQIVLMGGSRFIPKKWHNNPVRHGDSYRPDFICPIEEAEKLQNEIRQRNHRTTLVNYLRNFRWQDLPTEKLEQIKTLIDDELQPKPEPFP